ncbi:Saccharopine dehydrogenase [Perilla frutescens var. hirtella]|uniref:Saccharopine dehydrogenase n=1 Tax=Perilla frutescens var. hirtella TaxID=608512 RepID=A0AAD4JAW8_PERFH|nr:Saccharopine dehydrogenase [Perilla frutescens var. hirtella]
MAEIINPGSRSTKAYDVVILGASGFTGKYVVREALKFLNAPNSPLKSLALAGRSPSRLSETLKWAAGPNSTPPEIPLLTADTSDPDSLARVASQTKIILDCVGPFHLYGPPVVAACVEAGCDYLDITGEVDFMERMEASYHDKAVESGSLVISACGFESTVAEIGLLFHSRQWGGPSVPNRVDAYVSLESGKRIVFNYGTYESLVLVAANAHKRARPVIPGAAPPKDTPIIEYQKQLGLWGVKVPSINSAVIRRTQATLAENPHGLPGANESVEAVKKREEFWSRAKLPSHFGEKLGLKSLFGLIPIMIFAIFLLVLSKSRVGRWVLLQFPTFFSLGLFRKSGPSEEEISSARFKLWFVGKGAGTKVVTRVTGPEIGYVATPIILVQCALVVLNDRAALPKGGVYTPGIAFGLTDLQKRLQDNGISFDFISKKSI